MKIRPSFWRKKYFYISRISSKNLPTPFTQKLCLPTQSKRPLRWSHRMRKRQCLQVVNKWHFKCSTPRFCLFWGTTTCWLGVVYFIMLFLSSACFSVDSIRQAHNSDPKCCFYFSLGIQCNSFLPELLPKIERPCVDSVDFTNCYVRNCSFCAWFSIRLFSFVLPLWYWSISSNNWVTEYFRKYIYSQF